MLSVPKWNKLLFVGDKPTIDRTDSGDGICLKSSGHKKFYKWVLKNW
jgi:hypothetical protein